MNSSSNSFMLEVKNLNKRFGYVHAVKNLNFKIRKGEIFGFLGPNGAGKTTTMRIVTCYIPATSGEIRVDGLDTVEQSLQVRKRIGYLPENTPLYNDMTVKEYLQFVGDIRGLKGAHLTSRRDEMLSVCGLTKMSGRLIGRLSKGFRQRVGLAQAMIHNPELLILDEPMSGLDPNQIVDIRQLIKKVGQEKTVIYCSHILSEVSATCDNILIINDGSIVATGSPNELTSRASKQNRYNIRLKGEQESVKSVLATINGVSSVQVQNDGSDWLRTEVISSGQEDIGEQLFRLVVDNGWSMAELKRESASLEEVFTQLTRG